MRSIVGSIVLVLLSACGGGGGGDDEPAPPPPPPVDDFGLSERETLAAVDLPTGATAPGSFDVVEAFPNLSFAQPVLVAAVPGEDRLVVVEKAGRVLAFDDDAATATTDVILDLGGTIATASEQGLLGLAFDPDFAQNGWLYVYYSLANPRSSVVARFTWNPTTGPIDPSSEKLIISVPQTTFGNHKAGMIAFGPDDMLYVALGDGGSSGDPDNRAQDLTDLLGKILRLDVHPADPADGYDIPLDNPFVNDPGARDEIFAYGLRNPFRFSFDVDGNLWAGDVGQGRLEEVDIVTSGGNYGWRVFEGTLPFDGSENSLPDSAFTFPIHEYGRSEGASITGGVVYRGAALTSLVGAYVYGDFVSGRVWALYYDGSQVQTNEQIATVSQPTAFGERDDGELLIVSFGGQLLSLVETDPGPGSGEVPMLLSQTGLFTGLADLTPASGLIEYGLNVPFWSDGAEKRRWIAVPNGQRIGFDATGAWSFPVGTLFVKHFEIATVAGDPSSIVRLETRVLIQGADGVSGFTYRWNDAGTDAVLVTDRETETLSITRADGTIEQQIYEYPGPADCLRCHTDAAGGVLGVRTRQLNRDFAFPEATDNVLRTFNHIGLFTTDIGDASSYEAYADTADPAFPVAERARTYLAVNCAQCHRPGGGTPVDLDLRFGVADADMHAIGVAPTAGDLGVGGAGIIAPGSPERSTLWLRMNRRDTDGMPPLASHRVDEAGVALIGDWIETL